MEPGEAQEEAVDLGHHLAVHNRNPQVWGAWGNPLRHPTAYRHHADVGTNDQTPRSHTREDVEHVQWEGDYRAQCPEKVAAPLAAPVHDMDYSVEEVGYNLGETPECERVNQVEGRMEAEVHTDTLALLPHTATHPLGRPCSVPSLLLPLALVPVLHTRVGTALDNTEAGASHTSVEVECQRWRLGSPVPFHNARERTEVWVGLAPLSRIHTPRTW